MTWPKNNLWVLLGVLLAGILMLAVAQIILICLMWTGSIQGHSAFMILPLLTIGCVIAFDDCLVAAAAADDDSDWGDWSEDDG